MNRGKLKIFWKVFIMTISMLCIMIVLAYLLIYLLLPNYYKEYKAEQFQTITDEFSSQLSKTNDFSEETGLLSDFAQNNGIDLELRSESGELLYDFYQGSYIVSDWEPAEITEEGAGISVEKSGEGNRTTENISIEKSYQLKDGTTRNLRVMVPLQPLNEAKIVIIRIYPVSCLICVIFALLFSLIFSRLYVKPIKRISRLSKRMSNLEPDIEIPVKTSDEIGELSKDINHLYKELKGTIDTLNREIDKYSGAENQKIGFLRTVSHELKTPLAAANALIEGMICEIPPYNTNPKKYLLECKEFLEKASLLIKESLSLSQAEYAEKEAECNVKDIILEVVSDYQMILRSKQISYEETVLEHISFTTRKGIFKKAISNIISNAVNYTPENGSIRIYYNTEKSALIIENSCVSISQSELECIFKPFYSGQNDNEMSNGLGLSIVKQLFELLHINYEFIPTQDNKGMQFIVEIVNRRVD